MDECKGGTRNDLEELIQQREEKRKNKHVADCEKRRGRGRLLWKACREIKDLVDFIWNLSF